jgi:hypothetical protein
VLKGTTILLICSNGSRLLSMLVTYCNHAYVRLMVLQGASAPTKQTLLRLPYTEPKKNKEATKP